MKIFNGKDNSKTGLNRFLYPVKRKFGHFSRQQVCTTTECNVHSFASVRQKNVSEFKVSFHGRKNPTSQRVSKRVIIKRLDYLLSTITR